MVERLRVLSEEETIQYRLKEKRKRSYIIKGIRIYEIRVSNPFYEIRLKITEVSRRLILASYARKYIHV